MRPELSSLRLWRMGGVGLAAPVTFRADRADRLAREGVDPALIPVLGRIPGLLFAARYDSTSTLSYSELGLGMFARPADGRLGFYCPLTWVDSAESLVAGRELWALPKRMGSFDWQVEGAEWTLRVSTSDGELISMSARAPAAGLSLPMGINCFNLREDGRPVRWSARSRSVVNRTRISIKIPAASELSGLGLGARYRGLFLDPLHLSIAVPRQKA